MSNVRQGGETKEKTSNKPRVKIKKLEIKSKSSAAEAKDEKPMRQYGQLRPDSTVSQFHEKGIILQSHERGELYPSSNRHTKEITVQLHTEIVINANLQQRAL